MATLDEKIEALEEAMASGVRVVSFDGHKTEYQDISEMQRAVDYFRAQKQTASGQRSVRANVGAFSRY
ncbi:MAG: hypothetical protein ABJL67_13410 [Sulfitobacter sp.]